MPQRARADRHLVAHPAHIDDHRVGRDLIEPAGELADHGKALTRATATLAGKPVVVLVFAGKAEHVRLSVWARPPAKVNSGAPIGGEAVS